MLRLMHVLILLISMHLQQPELYVRMVNLQEIYP